MHSVCGLFTCFFSNLSQTELIGAVEQSKCNKTETKTIYFLLQKREKKNEKYEIELLCGIRSYTRNHKITITFLNYSIFTEKIVYF